MKNAFTLEWEESLYGHPINNELESHLDVNHTIDDRDGVVIEEDTHKLAPIYAYYFGFPRVFEIGLVAMQC